MDDSGNGREADRGLSSPAAHRLLLLKLSLAPGFGDRRNADRLLVQATRWLRRHPEDRVILEARELLREQFPPVH